MKLLPIRVCSAKKSGVKFDFLDKIYTCPMLQAFFKAFGSYSYAVPSRKNGICFSWERTENYGDWQEKDRTKLLALLQQQATDPRYRYVYVYWNPCPPRHNCFVKLLRDAGFEVIERRRLVEIHDLLLQEEQRSSTSLVPADNVDTDGFKSLFDFGGVAKP